MLGVEPNSGEGGLVSFGTRYCPPSEVADPETIVPAMKAAGRLAPSRADVVRQAERRCAPMDERVVVVAMGRCRGEEMASWGRSYVLEQATAIGDFQVRSE